MDVNEWHITYHSDDIVQTTGRKHIVAGVLTERHWSTVTYTATTQLSLNIPVPTDVICINQRALKTLQTTTTSLLVDTHRHIN